MLDRVKKFLHWWNFYVKFIFMGEDNPLHKVAVLMPWVTLNLLRSPRKHSTTLNKLYHYLSNKAYYTSYGIKYKLTDLDSLGIVSPAFEPWMKYYLDCDNTRKVFIDVGAHVGKHTLYFAKKCPQGLVIAIEPYPESFKALIEGIKANNLRNVIPINKAAWNEETTLRFFLSQRSAWHSIKRVTNNFILVNTITIDKLVRELGIHEVHFVKIDVEGAEYEVLLGAMETLRKYHPRIIIEIQPENTDKVLSLLRNLGYRPVARPTDIDYVFDFKG